MSRSFYSALCQILFEKFVHLQGASFLWGCSIPLSQEFQYLLRISILDCEMEPWLHSAFFTEQLLNVSRNSYKNNPKHCGHLPRFNGLFFCLACRKQGLWENTRGASWVSGWVLFLLPWFPVPWVLEGASSVLGGEGHLVVNVVEAA